MYSIPVLTLTFDLPMLPVDIILRFYMTLYILDIIHGKFQIHTIHISSVTVSRSNIGSEMANLEHRLTWKVASLFPQNARVTSGTK